MDAEDFQLKHRISQMSSEDLLMMLRNHKKYRQEALDFAAEHLRFRNIQFDPPPPKPIVSIPKKKWGWRIGELVVGIIGITVCVYWLREIINHPEEWNVKLAMKLVLAIVVIAVTLFIRLTTVQDKDADKDRKGEKLDV